MIWLFVVIYIYVCSMTICIYIITYSIYVCNYVYFICLLNKRIVPGFGNVSFIGEFDKGPFV